MADNEFTKMLIKQIKKSDKYKSSKVGKIKELRIMHLETKTLRFEPYCEYTEFNIEINGGQLNINMKVYTNGEFEMY